MVNFFIGLLFSAGMFSVCYALCMLPLLYKRRDKAPPGQSEPTEQESMPTRAKPQVYFVSSSPPKRKRAKPKPRTIGLKGALLPEGTVVFADEGLLKKGDSSAKKATNHKTSKNEVSRRGKPQPSTFSPSPQRRSK